MLQYQLCITLALLITLHIFSYFGYNSSFVATSPLNGLQNTYNTIKLLKLFIYDKR